MRKTKAGRFKSTFPLVFFLEASALISNTDIVEKKAYSGDRDN